MPLELLIITADTVITRRLPPRGRVTIGRAEDNDITLREASISRRHALLDLGPPLRIEDAGSLNGLHVSRSEDAEGTARIVEYRVSPGSSMELRIGDGLRFGSTLLIVPREVSCEEPLASSCVTQPCAMPLVHDSAMRKLYEQVDLVARSSLHVLLEGETGVGKEVMADAIHRRSPRARGPLVSLNCATLSESLLESELFGHEAGAFTGATRTKPGLFEIAAGGTVFLDEVGELPISVQAKLLRVLEESKVLRVGGLEKRTIDVRFIAATNRGLVEESASGRFRRDLYFRLNGATLRIPPLRKRLLEIEPLSREFAARAAAQMMRPAPPLSDAALKALLAYDWPGNIRELRNVIERAVVYSKGKTILPEHLGLDVDAASNGLTCTLDSNHSTRPPRRAGKEESGVRPIVAPLRLPRGDDERQRILDALELCGGNQSKAAEMLGISRGTLLSRLDFYGIARPKKVR